MKHSANSLPRDDDTPFVMALTLPTELIDKIISSIDDDEHSLMLCSLVARDWVPCSRFHLFRSVQLIKNSLPSFLELLHDQHSTIRCAVECIGFDGSYGPSERGDWSQLVYDGLAELAPLLPGLSCLQLKYLRGFDSEQFIGPDILGLSSGLAPLTQLELCNVLFASFIEVSNLILASPALEDLFLMAVSWRGYRSGRISVSPMRLRRLGLMCDDRYQRDVMNWLLSQDPIPLISHLRFTVYKYRSASAIGQYLRIVGPSLTDLVLQFGSYSDAGK